MAEFNKEGLGQTILETKDTKLRLELLSKTLSRAKADQFVTVIVALYALSSLCRYVVIHHNPCRQYKIPFDMLVAAGSKPKQLKSSEEAILID